jgi:small conductance mechanosensitive channel
MPDWFPDSVAELAGFVPLRIAFLVVAALVLRYVLHRFINRALTRATGSHHRIKLRAAQALLAAATLPEDRREARILALGSLARSATTLVIYAIALLMIFGELGFNITSIIAGTSIVAVTVAFGLQNVVKDLISGVFMLVEDQLGVGDYVDLEKASGTVEAIGLRITQLRDDNGNVWYVRNGEVVRVGNYSQGGTGRPAEDAGVKVIRLAADAPAPAAGSPDGS